VVVVVGTVVVEVEVDVVVVVGAVVVVEAEVVAVTTVVVVSEIHRGDVVESLTAVAPTEVVIEATGLTDNDVVEAADINVTDSPDVEVDDSDVEDDDDGPAESGLGREPSVPDGVVDTSCPPTAPMSRPRSTPVADPAGRSRVASGPRPAWAEIWRCRRPRPTAKATTTTTTMSSHETSCHRRHQGPWVNSSSWETSALIQSAAPLFSRRHRTSNQCMDQQP